MIPFPFSELMQRSSRAFLANVKELQEIRIVADIARRWKFVVPKREA